MRLIRTLAPAAVLALAAGLNAQTTPGPTTGGTAPTPPMLIFPTNTAGPTTGGTATAGTGTTSAAAIMAGSPFPTQLTNMVGVPAALNVTDRQQAQLDTFTQRLRTQFQPQFDRLSGLPADQQAAQRELINREYTAAWINAARNVFTPNQLTRYQQLQLQLGGFASLTDPVVQRAISLTDAQMAALKQDLAWSDQQRAAIQQAAQANQARAVDLSNAFNTTAQTRFNQLLTPTQQQAWSQLTGTPFAFQPVFPTPGTTIAPPVITVPGRTGPGGAPIPSGPTRLAPLTPGQGPTTGGVAPPGGPTTGGPARPGGPTTGGTAPGGPGTVPPKM